MSAGAPSASTGDLSRPEGLRAALTAMGGTDAWSRFTIAHGASSWRLTGVVLKNNARTQISSDGSLGASTLPIPLGLPASVIDVAAIAGQLTGAGCADPSLTWTVSLARAAVTTLRCGDQVKSNTIAGTVVPAPAKASDAAGLASALAVAAKWAGAAPVSSVLWRPGAGAVSLSAPAGSGALACVVSVPIAGAGVALADAACGAAKTAPTFPLAKVVAVGMVTARTRAVGVGSTGESVEARAWRPNQPYLVMNSQNLLADMNGVILE